MNKNKKRLIALASAVVIIVLSLTFDRGYKADQINTDLVNQSVEGILKQSQASKKVLSGSDSSNIIQKIKVQGEIAAPMIDKESESSILSQIEKAKNDTNVKAILLAVDTPGGGVYESNIIYTALKNSGKDIYVSMESQATSGGYYISAPAKKIFANQETITGSIGVIMGGLSAQKFLNDNGIKNQIIRSGNQKAVGGFTEDMNEETIKTYQDINTEMYERFVNIIAEGRKMDVEKVKSLADGRIYTATQALNNGLIDKIASEEEVIKEIASEKGLNDPQVIEYKSNQTTGFLDQFLSMIAKSFVKEVESSLSAKSEAEFKYIA